MAGTAEFGSNPLFELHGYTLSRFLSYRASHFSLDGKHVSAVAHGHEGTPKGIAIDGTRYLHKASGTEEFDGFGPDNVSPAALLLSLLKKGRKLPV